MIAGETERVLRRELRGDNYDNLFGRNKNKGSGKGLFKRKKTAKAPLTEEELAAKKEKKQKIWSSISNGIKDSGGISGILGMISPKQEVQQDYRLDYTPPPPEDHTTSNTKIALYVGGGLGALLVTYLVINSVNKNKDTTSVPSPVKVTPV